MNERLLSELLQYSNDKEILIVNQKGRLEVLVCPFNVLVLHDIGKLKQEDVIEVESVKITIKLVTVYIIESKAYYYYHFEILP